MRSNRCVFLLAKFLNEPSRDKIIECIQVIESFPEQINGLTHLLSNSQLNWNYRPQGWSIKQVVHHCADSHMNCLIRFKLALTEIKPVIKPYLESQWAELADATDTDISASIMLLTSLHSKWVKLLKSLDTNDLQRIFIHPEHNWEISLAQTIALYAWHCKHHLAHIMIAIESNGKYN